MKSNAIMFTTKDVTPWEDVNLEGKFLILKGDNPKGQLVLATDGFGCDPTKHGTKIYLTECHNDNPKTGYIHRYQDVILGIATPEAIEKWKTVYGEFNKEVANFESYKEMANSITSLFSNIDN